MYKLFCTLCFTSSPIEGFVNLIRVLIYITVPKRWCQCLGLFHRPKNSVNRYQFYNAQPLCRFIVPYQISCSKRVWHGWIWSIPLTSPNPKGLSMFLPNNFENQIYRFDLPVLFMVRHFYRSNLPVLFIIRKNSNKK